MQHVPTDQPATKVQGGQPVPVRRSTPCTRKVLQVVRLELVQRPDVHVTVELTVTLEER
jgi:hypothetical protein